MNILYINHYAGSLEMGMAFRPYYLAREWVKAGHKVRIVGASFSHLRIKNPEVKRDFELQMIDGIEYQWVKTCTYDHNGVARAVTMAQFCGKLWWNAKRIADEFQPDVVISSSTYTFDTYPCQKIARLAQAKYIHENHDLWPLTLTTIGHMSRYHPFVLLNAAGLRSALKNAAEVVCVLPFAYEYFREFGFDDMRHFHHIPNGIVKEDWDNPLPLPDEHNKLFEKLRGKFIVLYLGGHALSNALWLLIDAAEQVRDLGNLAFVLIGKGNEKQNIVDYAKRKNCRNVYFLPPVSKRQVPSVLQAGSILYIGNEASALMKYGVGINKQYDYMMAEKPVLYAVSSRNNDVREARCGFSSESEDVDQLVANIRKAYETPVEKLAEMGTNGRRWCLENCRYSVLAGRFLQLMQ